jgi:plasmid stabilization system protein ParE
LDLRELLYGRRRNVYRIVFTIVGQRVNVLRVRHAAQDRLMPGDV